MDSEPFHTRLPIEVLRSVLEYDPETGLFLRRANGKPALNTMKATGYLWGRAAGKLLLAHRAAWAISHGCWVDSIDHINRVKTDNRLLNLRPASGTIQGLNRVALRHDETSLKGVGYLPAKRKWIARVAGRYLGCFRTAHEAAIGYDTAAKRMGIPADLLNFPGDS